MLKNSLIITAMLMFTGCGVIDDAVNTIVSTGVSEDDIREKEKVLIINEVSVSACAIIKTGLLDAGDFRNAEILVTNLGVTCATYGKKRGNSIDAECRELNLAVWLQEADHDIVDKLGAAEGDRACVIGGDA